MSREGGKGESHGIVKPKERLQSRYRMALGGPLFTAIFPVDTRLLFASTILLKGQNGSLALCTRVVGSLPDDN